ncbi:MAG: glycosyltransferase family 9 protein [Gammaproteobacteria bacterium]|nr:glycosyltransferase family 9 protein [Gammaproteobacteria bacterium]MDH5777447.1 glycosyltransferase family 9 protein [Gammaproteobacteria bacterium]
MAATKPEKILIVRNDKIGDFMLSYPAFALLKNSLPECQVCALVPPYTKDMAEACPWIDEVIIDEFQNKGLSADLKLISLFKQHQFDAIVSLYSTTRVAIASLLAGIPYRLAPATKLAQICYNHKLRQRRSRSEKPEYDYNCDLIRQFCTDHNIAINSSQQPPFLQFDEDYVATLRQSFCYQHQLSTQSKLIFIHPGSGGSARNLSIHQYAELASKLKSDTGHTLVISAGPGEYENAHKMAQLLDNTPHVIYESRDGLRQFAEHIQFADIFIGGSTGPVHIAGALNRPTVAFYPRRRSATALRWQTLNSSDCRLAFSPPGNAEEEDMGSININLIADKINQQYLG